MFFCRSGIPLPESQLNIFDARASIIGQVTDANGTPVPGVTVRIVRNDGFQFVFANNNGQFRFPDMPLGSYLLQAPGPSQESLLDFMEERMIDPLSAYTAIPPDIPPEVLADQEVDITNVDEVLAAYLEAVETLFSLGSSVTGPPPIPQPSKNSSSNSRALLRPKRAVRA